MSEKVYDYKLASKVCLVSGLIIGYYVGQRYNVKIKLLAKKVPTNA